MTEELGDAELIAAVRGGDVAAFDVLYRRHVQSAQRMARGLARDGSDADDLVAESFARLLSILREGGGPDSAFRPYLLTTMRNLFYEGLKRDRRVQVTDDMSTHEPGVPFVDTALQELEFSLVSRAFARLPERWQTVLWHTEVERERPAKVAPLLGLSPNGVAALAFRAREGLRQQYLQEHIATDPGEQCRWAIEHLGAYVRSGLSTRDQAKTEAHLAECRRCHVLFVELGEVNAGLRGVLAPALLAGSATGYLASGSAVSGATFWGTLRMVSKRRSTQAAGAAVVVAALAALAIALASQPQPIPPVQVADPPQAQPTAAPPATPAPTPQPSPPEPSAPSPKPERPAAAAMGVTLESVGSLVRGRPGTLALTTMNRGAPTVAFGPRAVVAAFKKALASDSGPLTALITLPAGMTLRAGVPGDSWQCGAAAGGISCTRPSLATGQSSRAFVPIDVSASAADGNLQVRLTAPNATATGVTAFSKVEASGLGARFAGVLPATVVTGGNTLLTCPILALGCLTARNGTALLGGIDNGDYFMTGYADPGAPSGAPHGAMVSGAKIALPGKVAWAGLYWSGSGSPPPNSQTFIWVPGTARYVSVAAERIDRISTPGFSQPAYQASADVTALVRGSSGGTWWVAAEDHAFAGGFGSFGGWALVLVVEDGGPLRTVAVMDGIQTLRGSQSVSTPVYGTPGTAARIAFVGWEGDRGIADDQLKLGGQTLGGANSGNIAASLAAGTPPGWNTFGVDARVLDGRLPPALPAISATTGEDAWLLGVVAIAS